MSKTPSTIAVEDPARGTTIASPPVIGRAAVQALTARARAAQAGWWAAGFRGRAAVLRELRRRLLREDERIIKTICAETGKPYDDALWELSVAVENLTFWTRHAERYLADEKVPARSLLTIGKRVRVRYEPLGLVGVIGPWNYPLVNAFCDCVPPLMAGNAVILKPSEVTPLTSLLMAELLADCGLPDGVFSVATGGAATGEAVVDAADSVMFTGSPRTGRAVMERAMQTMTPVALELGGKDAMIVCADADLDRAANGAAYYGLLNAGQICVSVERVYVEAPVHDEFVAKLVANVRTLRQGPPAGPGAVDVGAITFPPQIDIVEEHVHDAVEKGACVEVGGRRRSGQGRFYQPTVLTGVTHEMRCMREETYGPTIPVMRVADVDEAVRLANDSDYGLQASVWTRDLDKGEAIARRIEAGAVCINDAMTNNLAFGAPMGGWKGSGVGHRNGAGGIRKYCRAQTVMTTRVAPRRDAHMFPYARWRAQLVRRLLKLLYGQ
jgi:acyl-CoA reductase-like NAD-dependent aldehyde dehydrogenase